MKILFTAILVLLPAMGQAAPIFGYVLNSEQKTCDALPTGVTIYRMHAYFSKTDGGCSLYKINKEGLYDVHCPKTNTHYFMANNEPGCIDALKVLAHSGELK